MKGEGSLTQRTRMASRRRRTKRLDPKFCRQVAELYESGLSRRAVAHELGTSQSAVSRAMQVAGIPARGATQSLLSPARAPIHAVEAKGDTFHVTLRVIHPSGLDFEVAARYVGIAQPGVIRRVVEAMAYDVDEQVQAFDASVTALIEADERRREAA